MALADVCPPGHLRPQLGFESDAAPVYWAQAEAQEMLVGPWQTKGWMAESMPQGYQYLQASTRPLGLLPDELVDESSPEAGAVPQPRFGPGNVGGFGHADHMQQAFLLSHVMQQHRWSKEPALFLNSDAPQVSDMTALGVSKCIKAPASKSRAAAVSATPEAAPRRGVGASSQCASSSASSTQAYDNAAVLVEESQKGKKQLSPMEQQERVMLQQLQEQHLIEHQERVLQSLQLQRKALEDSIKFMQQPTIDQSSESQWYKVQMAAAAGEELLVSLQDTIHTCKWHESASTVGVISGGGHIFRKSAGARQKRISNEGQEYELSTICMVFDSSLRCGGVHTYNFHILGGELGPADGAGFTFDSKVRRRPIQQMSAVFLNKRGTICLRLRDQVTKLPRKLPPLEVGVLVVMTVDLDSFLVRFQVEKKGITVGVADANFKFLLESAIGSKINPQSLCSGFFSAVVTGDIAVCLY